MEVFWELLTGFLDLSIDRPWAFTPLFILEEFGLPLPLVLSGIFTYAGFSLSQGRVIALSLIGVNMLGALAGASLIYWGSRGGLAGLLWRFANRLTLGRYSLAEMMSRLKSESMFVVLGLRVSPLPLIVSSLYSGCVKVPYRNFLIGVVISTLSWNLVYMAVGFISGTVFRQFFGDISGPLRYLPILVVWLGLAVAFAIFRSRRKSKVEPVNPGS